MYKCWKRYQTVGGISYRGFLGWPRVTRVAEEDYTQKTCIERESLKMGTKISAQMRDI